MDRQAARSLLASLHAAQNAMYAGGDVGPVRALLTDDVEWTVPGENAIAGRYHGVDEVLGYFDRRRRLAGDTMRLHPGELLVGDNEHVASLTDGSATIGGAEHRWSTVGLYRFRGELIAACWLLPLDQTAFDKAWTRTVEFGEAMLAGIDHVQIAAPPGCEEAARRFYGRVLGLAELDKPEPLSGRGGTWFALGDQQLHIGVEADFAPARKAHPAIRVDPDELDQLAERLASAGVAARWDAALPGARRFYTDDPWGNRLEFLARPRPTRSTPW
jgi:catechol 2,3-dioxygenase-like lactoylglutathione lyase family enzyme/ketosteroid isomerase-like protein